MVDLDGVSSVQVEVLDAKSQITVIFELWRVLHIDIVLANGRLRNKMGYSLFH